MRIFYSAKFNEKFSQFPREIERKIQKQVDYLIENLRHPSLHAKRYDEEKGIWQARVDDNLRFYFTIQGNTYILLDIRKHQG